MFLAQGSEAGKVSRMLITRPAKIAPPPARAPPLCASAVLSFEAE